MSQMKPVRMDGGRRSPSLPGHVVDRALIEILGASDVPRSAYQLASSLHDLGHKVTPVSVYRALDRLIARDAVQKVESLSAFRLRDQARAVLVICSRCGRTVPLIADDAHFRLKSNIEEKGFSLKTLILEALGTCADCSHDAQDQAGSSICSKASQCVT